MSHRSRGFLFSAIFAAVAIVLPTIALSGENWIPNDNVTFWGTITANVCSTVPSTGAECCLSTHSVIGYGLFNGGTTINALIPDVFPELLHEYIDLRPFKDGKPHLVKGRFRVENLTGTDCVYLQVLAVDGFAHASFDSTTGTLHIPDLSVDGEGSYEVELGPPYNVLSVEPN